MKTVWACEGLEVGEFNLIPTESVRTPWVFLRKIKIRAAEESLPYQTLLSSLIHKYITGKIKLI